MFFIENRFHVTLRILSPEILYICCRIWILMLGKPKSLILISGHRPDGSIERTRMFAIRDVCKVALVSNHVQETHLASSFTSLLFCKGSSFTLLSFTCFFVREAVSQFYHRPDLHFGQISTVLYGTCENAAKRTPSPRVQRLSTNWDYAVDHVHSCCLCVTSFLKNIPIVCCSKASLKTHSLF